MLLLRQRGISSVYFILFTVVFIIASLFQVGWRPLYRLSFSLPPGVTAPHEPKQVDIHNGQSWTYQGSGFTPLAHFELEARLLMNIEYTAAGDHFKLSPYDLVVVWGPMSDTENLSQISFGHGYRVVTYLPGRGSNLDISTIRRNFSHIHVIPASEAISDKIYEMDAEDIIYIKGKLVSVESEGFGPWTSSLSRDDSGCEIMWVEEAAIIKKHPGFFAYLKRAYFGD